ncbi:Transmembrane GTPase Marf [Eumeta japonica]|uniref:Transmembrane GTPase Marf n=1 Tax=Eumeta variegata TaxID=151549 RepID=A0A4C1SW13_EUMVA|nr:Transmembrane GTPase Marf [Eumeta japonica]
MAAYVNRTVSMMAGDGPHITGANAAAIRLSSPNTDSPLQIFVRAKKKINDIFVEIDDYVKDVVNYMHAISQENKIVSSQDVENVQSYINKVQAIREVLKRDHMKVAFFGRTSNGKSTVINAMLHDKILPSGIGHTTNCFLQIEGSDTDEAFLRTDNSEDKLNVQSVASPLHPAMGAGASMSPRLGPGLHLKGDTAPSGLLFITWRLPSSSPCSSVTFSTHRALRLPGLAGASIL